MSRMIKVTALVVHALCDDGKIRKVALGGPQPKQVYKYVRQISGGTAKLLDQPVLIIADEPKKSLVDKVRDSLGLRPNLKSAI